MEFRENYLPYRLTLERGVAKFMFPETAVPQMLANSSNVFPLIAE